MRIAKDSSFRVDAAEEKQRFERRAVLVWAKAEKRTSYHTEGVAPAAAWLTIGEKAL